MAFLTLVKDPEHTPNPALKFFSALRELPSRFKRCLRAVGIFGTGDFSHTLLILAATQLLASSVGMVRAAQVAGLFYVLRNIVQVVASYPVGALADRYGSMPVLVVGYTLGALTAILAALAFMFDIDSIPLLSVIFIVAGLYMAVQEALEASVTADLLSGDKLGMAYGALGTVNGTAKLVSSSLVGILWTAVSPTFGFGLAALLMIAGTVDLMRLRMR